MNSAETKYTKVEYERRFLVLPNAKWQHLVEPYFKVIEDKYLLNTRLRLRRLTDSDTGRQLFKLNKKFASTSPYFQTIGRILFSPDEFKLFEHLEGVWLKKNRYYHNHLQHKFSIDVFEGALQGLILCEVETDGLEQLLQIEPPAYAHPEVTEDAFFTGGNLCCVSAAQLQEKLSSFQSGEPQS